MGCAHLLEALWLLSALEVPLPRTVAAVFFNKEETGLEGADAFVRSLPPGSTEVAFALESDAGAGTPLGIMTSAGPRWRALLANALEPVRALHADRVVAGFSGSNVARLASLGVPTAGLMANPHRYFRRHHSARDTIEGIDAREVSAGSAVIAVVAAAVSALPGPLPEVEAEE